MLIGSVVPAPHLASERTGGYPSVYRGPMRHLRRNRPFAETTGDRASAVWREISLYIIQLMITRRVLFAVDTFAPILIHNA